MVSVAALTFLRILHLTIDVLFAPQNIQVYHVEGSEMIEVTSKMTGQDLLEKVGAY